MRYFYLISWLLFGLQLNAQSNYWQQQVDYKMDIDMDVQKNQFTGKQVLKYTNNSPDTLHKAYFHLYYNAFQPGSDMAIRNDHLTDSDRRVKGRIPKLKPDEIGYHKIKTLTLDGIRVPFEVHGTIVKCNLPNSIKPGATVTFEMTFNSQVPLQIRRTGRDNKEGVRYSMSQWYPKICAYDQDGWHPYPYIGREFYSPWGDWEVNITIDKDYVIGGTGILTNANQIGKGYQPLNLKVPVPTTDKLTWNFKAENVIDFVWAADPDFKVIQKRAHDGTQLFFVFQLNEKTGENWNRLPRLMDESLKFMNARYGKYPFPQYAFIQGGDGGMEYPMATLITGERTLNSLVGVSIHELMHSWYQFLLATNEAKHPWMDEGFTSFGTSEVFNHLIKEKLIAGEYTEFPHLNNYSSYMALANSGFEEPLSTAADHYSKNAYYGIASYAKGAVYLAQMEYILGEKMFADALLQYYDQWSYKHPDPNKFLRVMEDVSDFELDWYNDYFVHSTRKIDYAVDSVYQLNDQTIIQLERIGLMPMPLDVEITYDNGTREIIHIPLDIMYGHKTAQHASEYSATFTPYKAWNWVDPSYTIHLKKDNKVTKVDINPSKKLADVNPENNIWTR